MSSTVSNADFLLALEALYQLANRSQYLTVADIQTQATSTLPANLQTVLDAGVRRGIFLKCVTSETAQTGSKVFQYTWNPDMLRSNTLNAQLLNNFCFHYVTNAQIKFDNRCPCTGKQGSVSDHK